MLIATAKCFCTCNRTQTSLWRGTPRCAVLLCCNVNQLRSDSSNPMHIMINAEDACGASCSVSSATSLILSITNKIMFIIVAASRICWWALRVCQEIVHAPRCDRKAAGTGNRRADNLEAVDSSTPLLDLVLYSSDALLSSLDASVCGFLQSLPCQAYSSAGLTLRFTPLATQQALLSLQSVFVLREGIRRDQHRYRLFWLTDS